MKQTADEHIKATTSLRPAQRTASANGAAIDVSEMGEALAVLNIGAFATGTLDVKFQESADGSSGWTDIADDASPVNPAAFGQKTTADANKQFVGRIDCEGTKPFIRAVATMASTPDATFSVDLYLIPNKEEAVAQTNASEFTVWETV